MKSATFLAGLLSVVLAAVGACRPSAAPAQGPAPAPSTVSSPLSPPVPVKVGVLGSITDAGIYIGFEKGYFKQEGLEIELIPFKNVLDMIPPLATEELAVGASSPNAGMYNAILRGISMKIVADKATQSPGRGATALAVRKDLHEAGQFRDYGDLKGKTVAILAQASSNHIDLDVALKKANLTLDDVNLVTMGFNDMALALANKSIDGAFVPEPQLTQGIEQGAMVRWKGVDEIYPNHTTAIILYAPKFSESEAARRFMVGYVKAVRDFNDAFGKGVNKSEVVSILAKQTPVKDLALYDKMVPIGMNPDGYVNVRSLEFDLDWYMAMGLVKERPDMSKVVDNSFADYAIQRLGRYR